MSKESIAKAVCPKCGSEGSYTAWASINTQVDPELKQMVRNASVFTYTCPCCLEKYDINQEFLYHQQEDKILIYCGNTETGLRALASFERMTDMTQAAFANMYRQINREAESEDYIYRVVKDRRRLLEKLRLFDDGWDDRIMEVIKSLYRLRIMEQIPDIQIDDILYDRQNGQSVLVVLRNDGGKLNPIPLEKSYAEMIISSISPMLLPIRKDREKNIDSDWAIRLLTALNNNA